MLNGTEIVNIIFLWNNDDSSRMLTGGSLYAYAHLNKSVGLCLIDTESKTFKILLHKAVCRLGRNTSDSTRTEDIFFSEKLFRFLHRKFTASGLDGSGGLCYHTDSNKGVSAPDRIL